MDSSRRRVIVNKSTVPVGSGNLVAALIHEGIRDRYPNTQPGIRFSVASNPEFLREGCALGDSLYPDRIVIGAEEEETLAILNELYRPLIDQTFDPPGTEALRERRVRVSRRSRRARPSAACGSTRRARMKRRTTPR